MNIFHRSIFSIFLFSFFFLLQISSVNAQSCPVGENWNGNYCQVFVCGEATKGGRQTFNGTWSDYFHGTTIIPLPAETDINNLTSDRIPLTYSTVDTSNKCEYFCSYDSSYDQISNRCLPCANGGCGSGGFTPSNVCVNGAIDAPTCTPPSNGFKCTGTRPADPNAIGCPLAGSTITSDTPITLVGACSADPKPKCEYICRDSYHFDSGSNSCVINSCADPSSLGPDANIFAQPDTTDLSLAENGQAYQFSSTGDNPRKCEFNCKGNAAYDGSSCQSCVGGCTNNQCNNGATNAPACDNVPAGSCTGADPANTTACPGNPNISSNTSKTIVDNGSCPTPSSRTCEYSCNFGYRYDGTSCVDVQNETTACKRSWMDGRADSRWKTTTSGATYSCVLPQVNLLDGQTQTFINVAVLMGDGYAPGEVTVTCDKGVLKHSGDSCGFTPTCDNGGLAKNDPACTCTVNGTTVDYLSNIDAYKATSTYANDIGNTCNDPTIKASSKCISYVPGGSPVPYAVGATGAVYTTCVIKSAEFDPPTCEISEGLSNCQATVYATTTNLTAQAVLTDDKPGVYSGSDTNAGTDVAVTFLDSITGLRPKVTLHYGSFDIFQIWDATSTGAAKHMLTEINGSATCVSGLSFNTTTGTCEKDAVVNLWSDHIDERVSYGNDVKLSWKTFGSESCMASGGWGLEKGTSTGHLYEEFWIHGNNNTGGTANQTNYTLSCRGASGVPIATTTSVYGCNSLNPVASSTECVAAPSVFQQEIVSPYVLAYIVVGCDRSDTYDVYKEGVLVSPNPLFPSASTTWIANGINTSDRWTSTTSLPDTPEQANFSVICHKTASDGKVFSTKNVFLYKSTPPKPIVSLRAAPANIVKGGSTVLNWDVTYPTSVQGNPPGSVPPCTFTAKAICVEGNCGGATDPRQLEEDAINVILSSSSTDIKDKYGSRPIASSTDYLIDDAHNTGKGVRIGDSTLPYTKQVLWRIAQYTDWKAAGRKTFKLNHSMNFKLKCGEGANESRNVRVMVTDKTEG